MRRKAIGLARRFCNSLSMGQPHPEAVAEALTQPGPELSSEPLYVKLRDWIDDCKTNHRLCEKSWVEKGAVPDLPKRVLKIKFTAGTYAVTLLDVPGAGQYAALSHCWGSYQPLTTKKSNLSRRKNGIPWDKLPKTFQDAIVVTHGLGLEYLWIDSLCILQDEDDKQDWIREAAKMGSVYENAWCTIAAVEGRDSRHGLFTQSDTIALTSEGSTSTSSEAPHHDLDDIISAYNDLPLFQRGWVLQERLLSRRVLYFCKREVIMECSTNIRCECSGTHFQQVGLEGPSGPKYGGLRAQVQSALHDLRAQTFQRIFLRSLVPRPAEPRSMADFTLRTWDSVLEHYARRHLTHHSDRLPAISGIAKAFAQSGELGRYWAGIWEARAIESLLWNV